MLVDSDAKDVLLVGIGPFAHLGVDVAARLRAQGIGATVIDPRWAIPVQPSIVELAASHRLVITLEDGIRVGGVGTRVRQVLREAGVDTAVDELGLPDQFIDHATREQILEDAGLTAAKIAQDVVSQVLGTRIPVARADGDERVADDPRLGRTALRTPDRAASADRGQAAREGRRARHSIPRPPGRARRARWPARAGIRRSAHRPSPERSAVRCRNPAHAVGALARRCAAIGACSAEGRRRRGRARCRAARPPRCCRHARAR